MKFFKLSVLIILFTLFQVTAKAANPDTKKNETAVMQIRVTGTVVDAEGVPLPGVTVLVKELQQGTVTDTDGKYTINVRGEYTVLTFSFIGYLSQDITVGNQTIIDVTMSEDSQQLDEVVVVGYGTMRKSDLTGAVVRVNMEEKEALANVTISQALSGAAPGISIVGTSGRAGADPSINIRGQNSFSGSQSPLVVLDGAIFYGSIADINVNDVESIDVLKDASAAAVYGSRSANGVILITTKKGKEGKPRVSFNSFYGWQWITNTNKRMMDGMEYAARLTDFDWQDALYAWYKTGPTSEAGRPARPDITDRNVLSGNKWLKGEEGQNIRDNNETDWRKIITNEAAPMQNYNLSFSGRTDRFNYFVSASYLDETGIQKFDFSRRVSFRINMDSKITDWLTLGINTTYSNRNSAGDRVALMDTYIRSASPWANNDSHLPPEQRKMVLIGENYMRHPLEAEGMWMHNESNQFFVVANAKVSIPWVQGLTYDFKYSQRVNNSENDRFYPAWTFEGNGRNGRAERRPSYGGDWLVDNIISYLRTFGDHSWNATLLYTRDYRYSRRFYMQAYNFENPVMGFNSMQMGAEITTSDAEVWMESRVGYMGRLNYTYKNRYMFTGTVRRDGSSTFPAGNKWATLPSVSLGWVLSDESFMSDFSSWLYSKIRLSYGVNGNPGAGRYSSLSRVGTGYYEWGSTLVVAAWPDRGGMGNAQLMWEKSTQTNLGIDFGLFKRVTGSIEMYTGTTTDVIVDRTMPWMSGFTQIKSNLGELQNKGLEISLNTINLQQTAIKWRSGASFFMNRNKILDIYGDGTQGDVGNGWFIGHSIGAIYDLERNGIWQEEDLFEGRIGPNGTVLKNWYPGHWKFTDGGVDANLNPIDPDGVISAAGDRKIIGYREANFRWTLSNTFNYKQWGLFVMFNSVMGGGNKNWNMHGCYESVNVQSRADDVRRMNQQGTRPYWTPFNRVNNTSGVFNEQPTFGDDIYESKQFVRLQDISLTYSFNRNQLSKMGGVFEQLQLYASGRNLYTWTKWPDWDPEVQFRQYSNNSNLNRTNFNMRNITVGLRLTF